MLINKSDVICNTIGLERIGVQTRFANKIVYFKAD